MKYKDAHTYTIKGGKKMKPITIKEERNMKPIIIKGGKEMKRLQRIMIFCLWVFGLLVIFGTQQAIAAGTASNVDITNTATIDYKVSSIDQTSIDGTVTFKVDNKVLVTVLATGASADVVPGKTDYVLAFSITNTGNTTQGYLLTTSGGSGDTFDMATVEIYLDVDASKTLNAGDTLYADATNVGNILADAHRDVLVVSDAPLTATDGQTAVYNLIAQTTDAGGVTVTEATSAADTPGAVDVVFADIAGDDDAVTDGKHSDLGTYTVTSADLTVSKTSEVISDSFNSEHFKAIPGALIRYTITVTNSGVKDATDVVIKDTIPTNTTYVAESITLDTVSKTDDGPDADGADWNVTNTGAVTVTIATLTHVPTTATITFDVTVN